MFRKTTAAAVSAFLLGLPQPAGAEGLAGSYLMARQASMFFDYRAAARYYDQVLARDPSDPGLLENTLVSYVGLGDFARARAIASEMRAGGLQSRIADMIVISEHFGNGEFDAVIADYQDGLSAGELVDGLATAWAHVGAGRMSDAVAAFDQVINTPGTEGLGLINKAFALAMAGDFEGADLILSGAAGGPPPATRPGIIAHAEILSQLERNAAAIELFEQTYGDLQDPAVEPRLKMLKEGRKLPFSMVTDARSGLAELFFNVAGLLQDEGAPSHALIYARVAESLVADDVDILLLCALLLEELQRYQLATDVYDRVPEDDPAFHIAEMGRAGALAASGKPDVAIEVLRRLSETHAELSIIHSALGDMLRRHNHFAEATRAYDKAIALYREPVPPHWVAYYARGITHERGGNWNLAEADFRRALELSPSQPFVLNYLGYSLVERREKLDEALSMIEDAVAAQPDNGFMADSLGWVLYRLGRYEDAVRHMVRAAGLEPVDPVISDHLGDALWAVGRHREAEFQWKRALSLVSLVTEDETEAEPDRIRHKLEVGLDRVLEEEGAEPLKVADGD